ncbi:MAG: glycosyltransferase [Chitinophagaceae bacterium]|nr:MAG: glycosyltransferase [Chitinophagaceae bacterium]
MRITAVIITCNRLELLPRALNSVKEQSRRPDYVYVVSNSTEENFCKEQKICTLLGFNLFRNYRTNNYAGALNTSIEEIVKQQGISDDIYFASLDDDDEWLPDYLSEIENSNTDNFDLIAASYLRNSSDENLLMVLPNTISEKDFLKGNPGIGGSNTFIRLKTLLKAGCFDEALHSSVDRDFFVRVFQQNPKYKIIQKLLVTAYTDKNRERLTTNREKKIKSLQIFFYKYQHLMNNVEKEQFFDRAKNYFGIEVFEIDIPQQTSPSIKKIDLEFKNKGDYQFVIGFIAGDKIIAERIARQIVEKQIPIDLVLIIEDVPKVEKLKTIEQVFTEHSIPFKIIRDNEWKQNLKSGYYGAYYQQYSDINSIPLGRTILHHHLFTETKDFDNPVFWIVDDDITFRSVISSTSNIENVDVFNIINENLENTAALIGGMSNDPPVPTLCCIRSQLVDFYHSIVAKGEKQQDGFSLREKPDYYYDLSDLHSDHLEIPIYHSSITANDLMQIFSGKSLSRPSLQKEVKTIKKTITRRGANTLVFNRELLQYYPVINLEVNNKHARRGDLVWALLNQVVSGRTIFEHTFSLEHNRPITDFNFSKELDKAAYDIIGYAFSKAILKSIETIKNETDPHRPKDIFDKILHEDFYNLFLTSYSHFLNKRKARFLMNYYRIAGITKLITEYQNVAKEVYNQLADESKLLSFEKTLHEASKEETLKTFFKELTTAIWSYSKSITEITENEDVYRKHLEQYFELNRPLRKLGSGAEGIVFTDNKFVYKCFFNILDNEWNFLKSKAECFRKSDLLENIECLEANDFRFIRYRYHNFRPLEKITLAELTNFLKFCKQNEFVFTNIKPENFIQTSSGKVKLIDYGKSFEPFNQNKFVNTIKRAFLLLKNPKMEDKDFQKLTSRINIEEEPNEIRGWENLKRAVEPRKKEEILDIEIISILKEYNPEKVLDYGSGKCKTSKQIETETKAKVFVYDINETVLKTRCEDFHRYFPNDRSFYNSFDFALLNLVLCEVDNDTVKGILADISKSLNANGKLVVSVCNPDFVHIYKTEFQNRNSIPQTKLNEEVITKTCSYTGNKKVEYHRPTEMYLELFSKNGFRLVKAIDTNGVNIETYEPASDFKIFILKKKTYAKKVNE